MDKQSFVKLSNKIFEEILSLTDTEINEFLSGNKKLVLADIKKESIKAIKKEEKKPIENSQIEYIVKKLDSVKNREEAKKLLADKKLTNKILRDVGDKLGLYINTKATKAKIIDTLIEETIGLKLKMKALRGK